MSNPLSRFNKLGIKINILCDDVAVSWHTAIPISMFSWGKVTKVTGSWFIGRAGGLRAEGTRDHQKWHRAAKVNNKTEHFFTLRYGERKRPPIVKLRYNKWLNWSDGIWIWLEPKSAVREEAEWLCSLLSSMGVRYLPQETVTGYRYKKHRSL